MSNELLAIIEYIEQERGINRDVLIEALEQALMSASKKSIHPANDLEVKVDRDTGEMKAWAKLEVVDGIPTTDQIVLGRARERFPDVEAGEVIKWEVTPRNFGRIAAQTAKQAIMQQLRMAEKEIVKDEFQDQIGQIVNGVVRRFESGNVIVDLQRAEGILTSKEKIPGEKYHPGDRINGLLIDVNTKGAGPSLVLSRSNPEFVIKLFEREVAEIHDGVVVIKGIAREPGSRTKIAVESNDSRVDPIGACVGMRGMRVKNITGELSGERIDIIRYDEDIRTYAANSLQPAKMKGIQLNPEKAGVLNAHVTPDQSRLAFGKRAQNVRLSSRLIGWTINIVEDVEEKEESFEDKLERTVSSLSEKLSVAPDVAKVLVQNGFISIDGLKAADPGDLSKIEGLEQSDVEKIVEAVQNLEETR